MAKKKRKTTTISTKKAATLSQSNLTKKEVIDDIKTATDFGRKQSKIKKKNKKSKKK